MILRITVSTKPGLKEEHQRRLAAAAGLSDLEVRRAYFFQTAREIPREKVDALRTQLADAVLEDAWTGARDEPRREVWVAYKRGVVDNECDSLVRLCGLFGIDAIAAKVATVYLSSDEGVAGFVRERHFNPNIEEMHFSEPHYDTLLPLGQYTPMETIDLSGAGDDELAAVGRANGRNLDLRQMKQVQRIQIETGAPHVTDVLLEALDARWSDHCYHTTWKSLGNLLNKLIDAARAAANPNVLSMFEDNAGVWDFYDGMAIALKGETHNGPSAISAYFGQLTKLGGVLRDILGAGLGGDPVGVFEYTATGVPHTPSPIEGRPAPREIALETIRAIKEYGNTFGVPMMWSRMCFHPAYRAKPFALGGTIGLIPREMAAKGRPQAGDLLMLIGGLTGNDGIHGASASSAGAEMDQAAVQIGSPLEEVKFNTAILDLRDHGCLRALTDVGGAGLNSAAGEIGDPCGVWLNMALVPLKTAGLPMWRILLSESQERMVLCVKPEKIEEARAILLRHEVRNTVIGKFTGQGRYVVVFDPAVKEDDVVAAPADAMPLAGEVGINVPYGLLKYEPEPAPQPVAPAWETVPTVWPSLTAEGLADAMPGLLADVEIQDQSLADSQYDSTVQGRRTYGPYAGTKRQTPTDYWAAEMLPGTGHAALFTPSFNPWLFEANPRLALRQCFFAALGKLVLAGAKVRDIALCDNFYTPHLSSDWAYWLVEMVEELASLVRFFRSPVISGKDSSAGSVRTPEGAIHVPPAVFLTALGKAESFDGLLRNEWRRAGNLLVEIGPACRSAAGTAAARAWGMTANDVDELNRDEYAAYLAALESADRSGWASGCAIGAGGIAAALARRAIASGMGAEIEMPAEGLWWLFAEHRCGAVLEVEESAAAALPEALTPRVIGRVTAAGPSLRLGGVELLTPAALERWAVSFEECLR
jgi:phosphoribosylformylglycinamidine synthase